MVAVKAKYAISVNERLRDVTEQNPREPGLMNNLKEQAAENRSSASFSCHWDQQRGLTSKYPHMRLATVSLREMKQNCEQMLQKPRNRTIGKYRRVLKKHDANFGIL